LIKKSILTIKAIALFDVLSWLPVLSGARPRARPGVGVQKRG
jgi:hypothetical protein